MKKTVTFEDIARRKSRNTTVCAQCKRFLTSSGFCSPCFRRGPKAVKK